jgi:hypothetical protein
VNSAARTKRPPITKGNVNGPGRTMRTAPIAMSVNPMTRTIVLRTGLGTERQIFLYSTF